MKMLKKNRMVLESIRVIIGQMQEFNKFNNSFTFDQMLALGNILINLDAILSKGDEYDK